MPLKLWVMEPWVVRLFLLILFVMVAVAVVRFVRLATRLYHYSGDPILPSRILKGEVDPEILAAYALAHPVLGDATRKCSPKP
jgi:hypothetical protein